MATINIRLDDKLKEDAEVVLSEIGLSMTNAITLYLKAVVRTNSIPFSLEVANRKTIKAFKEVDKITKSKNTKKYTNTNELKRDLKLNQ